jgi:hypothetical protein
LAVSVGPGSWLGLQLLVSLQFPPLVLIQL